jgi:hypothetical protein
MHLLSQYGIVFSLLAVALWIASDVTCYINMCVCVCVGVYGFALMWATETCAGNFKADPVFISMTWLWRSERSKSGVCCFVYVVWYIAVIDET